MTTMQYTQKAQQLVAHLEQPRWQRILLLSILGYEGAGCLTGGFLLIASPDGKYMDMPVTLMNGVFSDFLIPGIILFALGILTTAAFVAVLRKTKLDWLFADLSMGGLFIWFWAEIVILRELHWLHIMWGLPVVIGVFLSVPLVSYRDQTIRKALLLCGIVSSLYYFALNIFIPMLWDSYSTVTQTVSELSAIGAPTRFLWFWLCLIYSLLFAAFGVGVLKSADGKRTLRVAGLLIIANSIINIYWPPMHQREILAAGGGTLTDILHIVWAMAQVFFMMLVMGFGAAAFGKKFRIYTVVNFIAFTILGVLIAIETPNMSINGSTPYIGIWERGNIAVFMIWVIMFAGALWKSSNAHYKHNA